MTALPPDVVADLRLENARLVSELRAARDRQTASAEILRTIASTSGDAERALQQIADATAQLFGASSVTLRIASGDEWIRTINVGASAKRISSEVSAAQLRIGGHNLPGTVLRENRQIHVPDINNVDPAIADWPGLPPARAAGTRAMAGTPLRREGKAIGALIVHRDRPVPFTDEELALLQSFADQAVIAIENTRLFNETKEALARQTATSDILRVISQSPTDVQPVFDAIVLTAVRLLRCDMSFVMFCDSAAFWVAAAARPESLFDELTLIKVPIDPSANFPSRAIVEKKALHLPDWSLIDLPEHERHIYETIGINSALYLPLLREGECIGLLTFGGKRAGMFGESEIALAESFRDQALIAIENTRLFNETREALDRQTATAEILKVIASSPSDVQPVFDVIVERAVRLCGGRMGRVYRYDDGVIQMVAGHALSAPGLGKVQQVFPRPATDDTIVGQVMLSRRPYILADIEHDESVPPLSRQMIEALGTRSQVTMPMLLSGEPIGAITVGWADPGAYKDQQITLLQTFADQAVIAIENVRLFNETREALERQTATADILKVIASSPSDVQPVFEAIASSANRLIGGYSTSVFSIVDDVVHLSALTPTNPKADAALKASFPRPLSTQPGSEQTRNGEVVAVADIETDPAVPTDLRNVWRMRGFRSLLLVPLVKEQATIGMISVTRKEPGRFAAHHVQLLQTFADQAVIAIENTRLFNETKEALEQQQATSEVLQVIGNSVANTAPVFEKILDGCEKLFATEQLGVSLVRDGQIHVAAWRGSALEAMVATFPKPVEQTVIGRAIQDRRILHVPNAAAMPDMPATVRGVYDRIGDFSIAWAPMLREQRGVGAIVALRQPPKPFSEKELALLQTFADQAVIAIENTRLFNETREALERQTATAEILKVIASSPSDVQPVFEAIATSANRLIGGHSTAVLRFIGDALHLAAFTPTNAAADEALKATFPRPIAEFPPFLLVRDGETVQFADTESEDVPGVNRELARLRGYRSMLFTPLMSGVTQIGLISVTRKEPGKFAEHHIQLVRTFADQAVIAIENVRLFDQVQAKTRDLTEALTYQTGSGNILRVIASSPTDVEPVLKAIVESACELCEADDALATLKDGDDLVFQAQHGSIPVVWERMPINRQWASGRAVVDRKPVHVHDLLATGGEQFPDSQEFARRTNVRTVLSVPLLRENESIGAIVLRRTQVQPFSDKQISLLQTFADQAVIAIGNVRLFEQVQQRTQELSKSLDDLRTAQDRLIQTEKLASLGQLTAGIAHEIKNPLNFVNNFSALSAELTDELNDLLKSAEFSGKMRDEVSELTSMLKDNLEKVVQHGKRADSIVKNMLLHSREGSGEHRPADINALLDESLNLAYHGARAEKREFNVTLQRDFDEMAGTIEVFPQEITRVFLNLISNGFYAVTKRKTENGGTGFDPILRATTRNLGDTVEIRIRDNGTGIAAEVKEKMFNPFFTTKPAGEGTGLGLSMSHDIIVKQHGGTIDVETEPGQFTEFTIVLPRTSNLQEKKRGQT